MAREQNLYCAGADVCIMGCKKLFEKGWVAGMTRLELIPVYLTLHRSVIQIACGSWRQGPLRRDRPAF